MINNNVNQQQVIGSPSTLVSYFSPFSVNNQNIRVYPIQVKNSRIILPKEHNQSNKVVIGPLVTADQVEQQATSHTTSNNQTDPVKAKALQKVMKLNNHIMKCPYDDCQTEFAFSVQLKDHCTECHENEPPVEKMFVCNHPQCTYSATTYGYLNRHRKASHGPRIQCPHEGCDKSFATKAGLKCHMDSHILERFECTFVGCNKTFRTRDILKDHQNLHTKDKLYYCQWPGCDFKTPNKGVIYRHKAVHSTDYKFVCDQPDCQSKFKLKSYLVRHKLLVHSDVPKKYSCTWPGCTFASHMRIMVNKHELIHTGGEAGGVPVARVSVQGL